MDGVHVPVPGLAEPRASLFGYANLNTGTRVALHYRSMLILCFSIAEKVNLSKKFYSLLPRPSGTYIFR